MSRPRRNPYALAGMMADRAPLILAKYFRPDCCIAATRVALSVFERFGIPTGPVVCQVMILNPAYKARVDAGRPCRDQDAISEAFHEDGSWTVGIGFGPPPHVIRPGFDGHLCVAIPRRCGDETPGVLLDLTLGQATRPDKGIRLHSHAFALGSGFWNGGGGYEFIEINGSMVGYARKPDALTINTSQDYQVSPDWRNLGGRLDAPIEELYRACLAGTDMRDFEKPKIVKRRR